MAITQALIFTTMALGCRESRAIPDPDTSSMERQVADKIARSRREVQEEIDSAGRWGKLGMVFQAHDLFSEATSSYAEARKLDPNDYRWPYLESRSLKEQLETARAIEAVEIAMALEPEYAPLFVLKAELFEQMGRSEEALVLYRRALVVDPDCAVAHFGVGRLALDSEAGLHHLERAAALEPEAGAIQALLARAHQRTGNREGASRAAALARTLHPQVPLDDPVMAAVAEEAISAVGLQTRAVEAEARGEPQRAEALLRKLIELRPDDANLPYNLANHLSRQGRFEEAEPLYRKALEMEPDHVPALIHLGILLGRRAELLEARRLFEKALDFDPENTSALASLGKLVALEGDLEGAMRLFDRSLTLDPVNLETHRALAHMHASAGRHTEAISGLRRALELEPARGDLHFELAVLLARAGDLDAARIQATAAQAHGFQLPEDFLHALR